MSEHFLYALAFSDQVVKVGRTQHLRQRFRAHRSDARIRGAEFVVGWFSDPHSRDDVCKAEASLKRMCAERWPNAWGAEYFACPNFDELAELAADLNEDLLISTGRAVQMPDGSLRAA